MQMGGETRSAQPEDRTMWHALALDLAGLFVGRPLTEALREMERAQWLSPAELQERTQARLAPLLRHAAENVPFYRDVGRGLGLDSNTLRTIDDLRALPVVSKATYRSQPLERFLAANIPVYRRVERVTSGSTGEPLRFYLDRQTSPLIFASHLFYDSWHGLRPFDRYLRIVSPPAAAPALPEDTPVGFRLRQALRQRLQRLYEIWTQQKITVWEVDGERAEEVWRSIEKFRPRFVMGYTSTLATIADELLRRGRRLSRPLRGVITIAETLSPLRRRLIDQYFGAPIINRYGLREFGSWSAQSCRQSPEQFHVNSELVVCEVVREDGLPAKPGEAGRVVLTDLFNYAMPFIRYDTGDVAVAGPSQCACGRGFQVLGPIEGRSQECLVTPSGKVISPAILGHSLWVYHGHQDAVRHYQLVVEAPDRARLLVVPANGWDERRRQYLREDLARLVGDDMRLSVDAVDAIPLERSGKRPIIRLWTAQTGLGMGDSG